MTALICGAQGVHEDVITVRCTRPAGHVGQHTNQARGAAWTDGGPITDLMGRPWLLGTLPPSRPRHRSHTRRR